MAGRSVRCDLPAPGIFLPPRPVTIAAPENHDRILQRPRITTSAPDSRKIRWLIGVSGLMLGAVLVFAAMPWISPQAVSAFERDLEVDLQQSKQTLERQKQEIATLRRGTQVTEAANEELKREIARLENQITDLTSEVAFYQRLLESGSNQTGLIIHSFLLEPTTVADVFSYELTLSQNLTQAAVIEGTFELLIEGVRDGQVETLAASDESGTAGSFGFKFYQQIRGSLTIPADMLPQALSVQLAQSEPRRRQVNRRFEWGDMLGESAR